MEKITFVKAINLAFKDSMKNDKKVLCMGLGVPDPKGIFSTTLELQELFGEERVFDIPTSENALTGICIGLAIKGYKPVLNHQRLDFALLSLDQIINNAAKIHYMFGGQLTCPIVIRMIVGRGWGQGPTHSQNLQQLFAGIPGLKVVIPATPQDGYSLLRASINDKNPVIFIEHRWLHNSEGLVDYKYNNDDLNKQIIFGEGKDFLIIACSYMVPEAIRALNLIENNSLLKGTIINLRIYDNQKLDEILNHCKSHKNVLIIDTANYGLSIAHLIYYEICKLKLKVKKSILTMPDIPEPTSYYLTKNFYIGSIDIMNKIEEMLGINLQKAKKQISIPEHHDIPGKWFKGPF